jgi:hypothetical protein
MMALTAGFKGLGSIIGAATKPTLEPYPFEAERAAHSGYITRELQKQRREALPVVRMEAQRAGMPMSGAYLESVTDIEKQLSELRGREIGRFEMEQMGAKREWEQRRALSRYEKGQAMSGAIGGMFGEAAAIPMGVYSEQVRQQTLDLDKMFLAYSMAKDLGDVEKIKSITDYLGKSLGVPLSRANPTALPPPQRPALPVY